MKDDSAAEKRREGDTNKGGETGGVDGDGERTKKQ